MASPRRLLLACLATWAAAGAQAQSLSELTQIAQDYDAAWLAGQARAGLLPSAALIGPAIPSRQSIGLRAPAPGSYADISHRCASAAGQPT